MCFVISYHFKGLLYYGGFDDGCGDFVGSFIAGIALDASCFQNSKLELVSLIVEHTISYTSIIFSTNDFTDASSGLLSFTIVVIICL